ncbi:hypothetical protein B0H17DRAFT_1334730 [Mycena rosella]|uniref:Uncharacterized protein n=1 Tax=Mycena rosella TaxID=1033263 RepID=A0AAD7D2P8_MYCRO|nr:hypothetical protein B0H17DRAFT_1334730 [Mycena rosella]
MSLRLTNRYPTLPASCAAGRTVSSWDFLLLVVAFLTVTDAHPKLRHIARVYNYYVADAGSWRTVHNLSLPFPEDKTGRYVKSNQGPGVEQLPQRGPAGRARRVGFRAHARVPRLLLVARGPREQWVSVWPCTPLNAIVAGPFDVVCPPHERRYINTRDVKPAVARAPSPAVLAHWQALLRAAPECCIEVVAARTDPFPQTFDLALWGSPCVLPLLLALAASPISRRPTRARRSSRRAPTPSRACSPWNLLPALDRFVPGRTRPPSRAATPTSRAHAGQHASANATLDVLYVVTNERGPRARRGAGGRGDGGGYGDRAAGGGVSQERGADRFTSNVVYTRLVNGRAARDIRLIIDYTLR